MEKIKELASVSRHIYQAIEMFLADRDSDAQWEVRCAIGKLEDVYDGSHD